MKKVDFTLFENIDETCAIIDIGQLTVDVINVIQAQNSKPDFSKGTRQQRRKIEKSEIKKQRK